MKFQSIQVALALLIAVSNTNHYSTAFTTTSTSTSAAAAAAAVPARIATSNTAKTLSSLFPQPRRQQHHSHSSIKKLTTLLKASSTALTPPTNSNSEDNNNNSNKKPGFLAFKTPAGYLNPYGIFYGLASYILGIPWFIALNLCQLIYKLTNYKFDTKRKIPMFASQLWGQVLLFLTYNKPIIENRHILEKFYKENRAAMFVANHNSFMDIPISAQVFGFRNSKMVSKVELTKVPILGRAIKVGGHVIVDRSSRKSQILTLKSGMQWLKDGVHLITFPEGTRSTDGRLLPFKNGAFKMAHKVGAPVVPLSIVGANVTNPPSWLFPRRPGRGIFKIVVHEPVESEGISEDELAKVVRQRVLEGLPESMHPLPSNDDKDDE
jgi:1-acyl-sn-glycerol-3-phosphate acyltransferase